MTTIEQKLSELFEPIAAHMGLEFVGLRYLPQGKYTMLRVYIDKTGGVNHEDCAALSHQISGVLDVEDAIKSQYTLEVSSPGINRPLFSAAQYAQLVGEAVQIRLAKMVDGRRKLSGTIVRVTDDIIQILADDKTWDLDIKQIEQGHIVAKIDWK